ncbi:hypothetical protein [Paraburkholderia graminis]|uniref:hypothetical protein n=1 Tax=Paraburkholderia graminis TaxID=60548 RepID=UPI0038B91282
MHTSTPGFQTEIEFELPRGYVDGDGVLHRRGVMRLATAADEILPLRDPRVAQNEAYLTVIVLARVIVRLGALTDIHTGIIEGLFAGDLAYLQRCYERFNAGDDEEAPAKPVPPRNGASLQRMTTLGEA